MQIGEVTVDISSTLGKPKTDRGVGLYLYFGRTTIEVTAKEIATGATVATRLEFRTRY